MGRLRFAHLANCMCVCFFFLHRTPVLHKRVAFEHWKCSFHSVNMPSAVFN